VAAFLPSLGAVLPAALVRSSFEDRFFLHIPGKEGGFASCRVGKVLDEGDAARPRAFQKGEEGSRSVLRSNPRKETGARLRGPDSRLASTPGKKNEVRSEGPVAIKGSSSY